MGKERKVEFYDNLREKEWKDTANYGPSVRSRYRVVLNLLKRHVKNRDSLVLDSGCGSGNFLNLLKEEGFTNIEGSDFSTGAVKMSQERNPDIKVFQQDLTERYKDLSYKYDAILCSEVLEHIEKDEKAISNMYSYLKDGGFLIISVPAFMRYWTQHDDFSGHVRRYEIKEMSKNLEKSGFEVVRRFYWGVLFYELYYKLLGRTKPKRIMAPSGKGFSLRIVFSRFLYLLFLLEDFLINKYRGRRLFVVGIKKK